MNILITSVGKRVSLIKLFQQTLKNTYPDAMVYTTDMNPALAPAGIISDRCFESPRVTATCYIEFLLGICIENKIRIIIPTIDTELLILAENKAIFQKNGIEPLVSNKSFISVCRDKRKTRNYLEKSGIRTPKLINKYHPSFPLFAKPYDGSLSKDIFVIKNKEGLTSEIINNPKLIFMEYIDKDKYQEFTVDMYYGRDNKVKAIIPRERIEIRAGEINKGYTRKNYLVNFLKERMDYLPGVIGCICIQLFYREKDNDVIGIEINPRFGGGYPLSYYAKADFITYIIKEYFLEETIKYSDYWLDNTLMLRYDAEIIVYENEKNRCF
ncbi:MAG: ATP-grasp domain-containing protein [Prevotellaceae bacterium]|jgi:carbamoyl-phosphate synthase large subunit|nr:ATP-grasp domain-containing protein [Prevotellaceae bacterium]